MKVAEGEGKAVVVSVQCLRPIFSNKAFGRVAIVAGCNVVMVTHLPSFQLVAHDVTIRAYLWIVAHVRIAASVHKGKRRDRDGQGATDPQYDGV